MESLPGVLRRRDAARVAKIAGIRVVHDRRLRPGLPSPSHRVGGVQHAALPAFPVASHRATGARGEPLVYGTIQEDIERDYGDAYAGMVSRTAPAVCFIVLVGAD